MMDFWFRWRHIDGSIVTFSPDGWACSDPEKTAWLNSMNHLTSSRPSAAPCVRKWLEDECELLEARGPDLS